MFQLSKLLSRPDHPWRKFGSGNKESLLEVGKLQEKKMKDEAPAASVLADSEGQQLLPPAPSPAPSAASGAVTPAEDGGISGRETRRRLVEWWEQQYCASRMKLVLLGKGG